MSDGYSKTKMTGNIHKDGERLLQYISVFTKQDSYMDRLAARLHGGRITYVINPNEYEQRLDPLKLDGAHTSSHAHSLSFARHRSLRSAFDKLIEVPPELASWNINAIQQRQSKSTLSTQASFSKNTNDGNCVRPWTKSSSTLKARSAFPPCPAKSGGFDERWHLPPQSVIRDSFLYWIMLICVPEVSLLMDEVDVVNALSEFKRDFRDSLSKEDDLMNEYIGADYKKRNKCDKLATEALLRALHSSNFDDTMHDVIPTFASRHYSLHLLIYNKNGVKQEYTCHSSSPDRIVQTIHLRQLADNRFSKREGEQV